MAPFIPHHLKSICFCLYILGIYIDAITSEGRLFTDINLNMLSFDLSTTHIFAVGDCRYKPFNQVVIAMSEGCQAALSIIRDLEK